MKSTSKSGRFLYQDAQEYRGFRSVRDNKRLARRADRRTFSVDAELVHDEIDSWDQMCQCEACG